MKTDKKKHLYQSLEEMQRSRQLFRPCTNKLFKLFIIS